jgi:YfiH family protein
MRTRDSSAPIDRKGTWIWDFQGHRCQVLFLGKGPLADRLEAFHEVVNRTDLALSWLEQVHSGRAIRASQPGLCGAADALWVSADLTALSVATADCVPIVVAGPGGLATIHAGWRGLVNGVIQSALEGLAGESKPLQAWIGPAIGPCCYEVAPDVANQVVAASDPMVLRPQEPRPHLDLAGAAEWQLSRGTVSVCTRCSPEWLWSYRRDGAKAGRNWTFAWRQEV